MSNAAIKQSVLSHDLLHSLQDDQAGFEELSRYLLQEAGINLPTNTKNLSLMAARLNPIMRKREIANYRDYLRILKTGSKEVKSEFIQALTTNTTHFFRENRHFEIFDQILKERQSKEAGFGKHQEIRVWCAAASTGQEPYTILFTLLQALNQSGASGFNGNNGISIPNIKMLATDIDRSVLEKAASGTYRLSDLQHLPEDIFKKFFTRGSNQKEDIFRVRSELRLAIRFAELNLLEPKYPFQHQFDFIFCRNVLIYFNRETTEKVIYNMASVLKPGGYLFLGHSESGMVKCDLLKSVASAVYRRVK